MTKACSSCAEVKPEDEFYSKHGQCKACVRAIRKQYRIDHREELSAKAKSPQGRSYSRDYMRRRRLDPAYRQKKKQWAAEAKRRNPFYWKDYSLRKQYGISLLEYNLLLKRQNGVCAICLRPERSDRYKHFSVDHDHVTGKVRGLLCSGCNRAIGIMGDDAVRLRRASEYLESASRKMEALA